GGPAAGARADLARPRAAQRGRHPGGARLTQAAAAERPRGLRRVRTLWRLFRREKTDPAPFYRLLAAELADQLDARYGPLEGQTIVDLGCGPGFYTEALRAKDAEVIPVDNDLAEMEMVGRAPPGALVADAAALPLAEA